MLNALVPDRHRRIDFDEEKALASIGTEPTLRQLLDEFRNQSR
jgi:hypothetical protein